jgi:hypothetical protein
VGKLQEFSITSKEDIIMISKVLLILLFFSLNFMYSGSTDFAIAGNANAGNTKDVTVVNDSSNPVPVTGDVEVVSKIEPILLKKTISCSSTTGFCGAYIYSVPEGKRLTLEFVSCYAFLKEGEAIQCSIGVCSRTDTGTTLYYYYLPMSQPVLPPAPAGTQIGIGQQVKLYSSCDVYANVGVRGSTDPRVEDLYVTLSGYLENIP